MDWSLVANDGGVAILVIDLEGRVHFLNSAAARVLAKRPQRDALGQRLADLLPPAAAAERLDLVRQTIQTGAPVILRDLWGGYAMRATIRRVDNYPGVAGSVALWTACQESAFLDDGADEDGARVVQARHVDLGPLSCLTASELKVLALIGEGMTNAEIAATLHRAVKTVESHRAALTDKTGSTSRVQLGALARRAGLAKRLSLNGSSPVSVHG